MSAEVRCAMLLSICVALASVLCAEPLTPDELLFVSKLSDSHRKTFAEKFTPEQRKAVIIAYENGAVPNEAVHRMVTAAEVVERGQFNIASSEEE